MKWDWRIYFSSEGRHARIFRLAKMETMPGIEPASLGSTVEYVNQWAKASTACACYRTIIVIAIYKMLKKLPAMQ